MMYVSNIFMITLAGLVTNSNNLDCLSTHRFQNKKQLLEYHVIINIIQSHLINLLKHFHQLIQIKMLKYQHQYQYIKLMNHQVLKILS